LAGPPGAADRAVPAGRHDRHHRPHRAPKLSEALGKPLVIENRSGASGSVGAIEAARSAADGYTWLLAYDNEATNQTVMRLPYKLLEALAPVSLIATGPLAFVAHQSTP
jgi:tripartite-type tricarboxylate transporter receptor subunit TctC